MTMTFRKIYSKINQDKVIRSNLIYFIGSLIISFLNYLFYPIIGRLLTIQQFGDVQGFLSGFLIFGVLFSTFNIAITNISGKDKDIINNKLINSIQNIALIITFILFSLIIILSNTLKIFFNFNSIYSFISLGILLPILIYLTTRVAYFQGKHNFKIVSATGIIISSSKLITSIILIFLGFKEAGAIIGIVIAQLFGLYFVSSYYNKIKIPKSIHNENNELSNKKIQRESKYLIVIFITNITITLLYNSDILIVKHFFNSLQAGLYASISSVSNILYFLTTSVSFVLIASVNTDNTNGHNYNVLLKSFFIIILITSPLILFFYLYPSSIVKILMGDKYIVNSYLLPYMSISIFIAAINNLIFSFFISLKKYFISVIAIFGIIFGTILISNHHETLNQIVNSFIVTNGITLTLLFIYILYNLLLIKNYEK